MEVVSDSRFVCFYHADNIWGHPRPRDRGGHRHWWCHAGGGGVSWPSVQSYVLWIHLHGNQALIACAQFSQGELSNYTRTNSEKAEMRAGNWLEWGWERDMLENTRADEKTPNTAVLVNWSYVLIIIIRLEYYSASGFPLLSKLRDSRRRSVSIPLWDVFVS